ncbi:putative membrane protein [Paenibacillus sp. DS2015]|uniref:hypothetical protein n=1 Tax=Paenibacillus sp. DS2015 TaxID=3373917 RepID=UPI003D1DFBF9
MKTTTSPQNQPSVIIAVSQKSVGVALLLTFIFGPLGLFYSSIAGGIIMLCVNAFVLLISILTAGFGGVLFFLTQLICIIWGVTAAQKYNKRIMSGKVM